VIKAEVLLDTNLLVLLVVGTASRDYIGKHKRLSQFTVDDFDALMVMLSGAAAVLVTPNTLAETSNLAAYIDEPAKGRVMLTLRNIIELFDETYVSSRLAAGRTEFLRLGLTDVALMSISTAERVVLTADVDLYLAAVSAGLHAVNFFHLRDSQS